LKRSMDNAYSFHVCSLAILGQADWLPWQSAKVCYQSQLDFNYLEERDLFEQTVVDDKGLHIAGMSYRALILEHEPAAVIMTRLAPLIRAGRVFHYSPETSPEKLLSWLAGWLPTDLQATPSAPALRLRHVVKDQVHYYLLFNEQRHPLEARLRLAEPGQRLLFDPLTGQAEPLPESGLLRLDGYTLKVLLTEPYMTAFR